MHSQFDSTEAANVQLPTFGSDRMKWYKVLLAVVFTTGIWNAIPAAKVKQCFTETDIVFVMDASQSVTSSNFEKMRKFVKNVVDGLNIQDGTRVGIVPFKGHTFSILELGAKTTKADLKSVISKIPYNGQGSTYTHLALAEMKKMFKRKGRAKIPKVAVVITDGQSNFRSLTKEEAEKARAANIKIIALGIGRGPDKRELKDIATAPDSENVIIVKNFNSLNKFVDKLVGKACKPPSIRECVGARSDVVFALDESNSVGRNSFEKMKVFLKNVTKLMDVGETVTRVGVFTFSKKMRDQFSLGAAVTIADTLAEIDKISYQAGGYTRIGSALNEINKKLEKAPRTGSTRIGVIITDGESYGPDQFKVEDMAKKAHDNGIVLVAVGIGTRINQNELKTIATDPDKKHVLKINSFEQLAASTKALAKMTCGDAKKSL